MQRDWISCNTCGADDYRVMNQIGEWPIGKCFRCGTVYVNPIPVFSPNNEFSEVSKEFQYTQFMHGEISPEILRHDSAQLQRHCAKITRLTGSDWPKMRFLDVGCGSGASVKAATDAGWNATGVDLDPQLIACGKRQFDVDLRCTPLLDAGFADNSFNFVRLRDVIEHLPNPYAALLEIKRILTPGGVLLLATPNQEGLPTRVRVWLGRGHTKVATVPPPHHLHGFKPETLSRILHRSGLEVLEVTTTTPIDPAYVTANNMRAKRNPAYVLLWKGAQWLGQGSMVVAWGRKSSRETEAPNLDAPLHSA